MSRRTADRVVAVLLFGMVVVLLVGTALASVSPRAAESQILSPLEQARVENLNLLEEWRKAILEADTCRGQLAQPRTLVQEQLIREKATALTRDIERSHPGYVWNAQTGAFSPREHH